MHIILVGGGGIAPKRQQASQVVETSKRARNSAQHSQQGSAENSVLLVVKDLCGHLWRLEKCLGDSVTLGPLQLQDQGSGGSGSGAWGNTDRVMSDISYKICSYLAAVDKKVFPRVLSLWRSTFQYLLLQRSQ